MGSSLAHEVFFYGFFAISGIYCVVVQEQGGSMDSKDILGVVLSILIVLILVYFSRPLIDLEMVNEAVSGGTSKVVRHPNDGHAECYRVRVGGIVCRYRRAIHDPSLERLEITCTGARGTLIARFRNGRLRSWSNILESFDASSAHTNFIFEHLLGEVQLAVAANHSCLLGVHGS